MISRIYLLLFVMLTGLASCATSSEPSTTGQPAGGGNTLPTGGGYTPPACSDECSSPSCNYSGAVIGCQKGSDGCYKKLAATSCPASLVCMPISGCSKCLSQSACTSATEVCSPTASCVYYGGQTYNITIKTVTFDATDAKNIVWDYGSPPDPIVCVLQGSTKLKCTTIKQDTLSAYYGETLTVTLSSAADLTFEAWDSDAMADDYADSVSWASWASIVKNGGYSGDMYDGLVSFSFDIKPAGY